MRWNSEACVSSPASVLLAHLLKKKFLRKIKYKVTQHSVYILNPCQKIKLFSLEVHMPLAMFLTCDKPIM
jgi:hypothetical protein